MKLKNTLVLLGLLVVLSGYVYMVEIKGAKEKKEAQEASQQLFHFVQDSLTQVILHNDYGDFTFVRRNKIWYLEKPVSDLASESNLGSALDNLETVKYKTRFTIKPEEVGEYGLGAKALRVAVVDNQQNRDSLRIGDDTPVGSDVYAAKVDTVVYTIPRYVKISWNKKLFDFRDRNLLLFEKDDVQKVVLKNPHGKFVVENRGEDTWWLPEIDRRADERRIGKLLTELKTSRIKEFIDDYRSLKKYGLDPAPYEITLNLGPEHGTRILKISKKINNKYYGYNPERNPIFVVPASVVEAADLPLKTLRSPDIVQFERLKVSKIVYTTPDSNVVLTKDTTGAWHWETEGRPKLRVSDMVSYLFDIDHFTADDFVVDGQFDPARFGFDKPRLHIQLYNEENQLVVDIKIGKKKGNHYYATSNQNQTVYLIKQSEYDQLRLKLNKMIEKKATADTTAISRASKPESNS